MEKENGGERFFNVIRANYPNIKDKKKRTLLESLMRQNMMYIKEMNLELPDAKTSSRGCSLVTGLIVVMSVFITSATSFPVLMSIKSMGCNATPS